MPELLELSEKDQARFWSKVALPNEQGCMLWLGSRLPAGYGTLRVDGRTRYAHRISYELAHGLIPDGLVIDHLCRTPGCAAPNHLEAVTQQENVRRGEANGWRLTKTHCPHGHPYSGDNLIVDNASGARRCRACRNKQARDRWHAGRHS